MLPEKRGAFNNDNKKTENLAIMNACITYKGSPRYMK